MNIGGRYFNSKDVLWQRLRLHIAKRAGGFINPKVDREGIDLFFQKVFEKYGYDFRNYAEASVMRRINLLLDENKINSMAELCECVLQDEAMFHEVVHSFSIIVTELFRDPHFFRALRRIADLVFKDNSHINVWLAGCATGEEAYSLAILLKEVGLYERATILGTDFNPDALAVAEKGIYPLENIKAKEDEYLLAGGNNSLLDYYEILDDLAIFKSTLKENITFKQHNLVSDESMADMHLILCRNVIIYFNPVFKERVFKLFKESLYQGGILCLGLNEALYPSSVFKDFRALDNKLRIYQKHSSI